MQIALSGYGKMGKEIETIARERNHNVLLKINSDNRGDITSEVLKKCDVVIDFSRPDAVTDNIKLCFEAGVPVVVGTTGWYNKLEEIKKQCDEKKGALLFASNFSIGVNIFFRINKKLALLMKGSNYECTIKETHHTQKLDKPSGTAITLAEDILKSTEKYKMWNPERKEGMLYIESSRKENVPGTHTVSWQNEIDKIEITHEAFNRKGFATGAILAAEWIKERKGIYTMQDMMQY